MNTAFMDGVSSAKTRKKVLDNPYSFGQNQDEYKSVLWQQGFMFQLERENQCKS